MTIQTLIQEIAGNRHYLNLLTDWAFKIIFVNEENKHFLIAFLNQVLKEQEEIVSVEFQNPCYPGTTKESRAAIVDVLCKTTEGIYILVELQRVPQRHIKDRLLYYSTWPIQKQGKKGKWDFELSKVYSVGIFDFNTEDKNKDFFNQHMLINVKTLEIWTDKLTFITLELPKLQKTWNQCTSDLEKWVWLFKNLQNLNKGTIEIREQIFQELLATCEKDKFIETEWKQYEESVMAYADLKNYTDYAFEKGIEQGIAQGVERGIQKGMVAGRNEGQKQEALRIAREMLQNGLSVDKVAKITGLSVDEVEGIGLGK